MCRGCWEGEDSPTDWTPQIARAVVLWRRLYDDLRQPTGGPLHVELDDCNLDYDEIVPSYSLPAMGGRPATDDGYAPEVHEVCDELAALLTRMSTPERYATLAYADGFTSAPQGVQVAEDVVEEKQIRAPGGTWVRLTHKPTGVTVIGREGLTPDDARAHAWRMLRNRLTAESLTDGATAL
jgi:hypothetical protein